MIRKAGFVLVVASVVAACGGSAASTTTKAEPSTTTTTIGTAAEAVTVHVTASEYAFESDLTTFKVGVPYHFVVDNVGVKEHEFMILTPMESGMMDMEAMDQLAVAHIEEDDLPAGAQASVDYTFTDADAATPLEFSCHLASHYEDGMHMDITVTN